MHFLAHYYTELPANNPLFVAALTIPDLSPHFTKTYNAFIVKHPLPENENLQHIHSGIVQHFKADKKFHQSTLFLQLAKQTTELFLQAGLNRERLRLSVIAHVAVEMMLDRQLILANENICTEYYTLIAEADESTLSSYFDFFALKEEKKKFLRSFQFYKQKRFLFLFTELENIVFGLNRVYSSVTKTEFTETEKQKFLTALHNIDTAMRYSWQEILKR